MREIFGEIMGGFILVVLIICALVGIVMAYKTYQGKYTDQKHATFSTEYYDDDYFTPISDWSEDGMTYRLMYANDTKVIYLSAQSTYRYSVTPVMNADGTCQVYTGETTESATSATE
jgi:Na+/H+ antiporter NhaA